MLPMEEKLSTTFKSGARGRRNAKPRTGKSSNTPASFSFKKGEGEDGAMCGKPRLPSRPPVWSYGRQEMCESLMYWRAFQSSIYQSCGTAYSYLLDGFPSARDVWADEGRVIISHGGGNSMEFFVSDPSKPNNPPTRTFRLRQDQSSPTLDALLASARNRTPIILLAGSNYSEIPFELGCGYVVLGWYWISFVWIEPEEAAAGSKLVDGRSYFHRYKLRFDWIPSQGEPWWVFSDPSLPSTGWDPQEFAFATQQATNGPRAATPSIHSLEASPSEKGGMDVDLLDSPPSVPSASNSSSSSTRNHLSSSTSSSSIASPSPDPEADTDLDVSLSPRSSTSSSNKSLASSLLSSSSFGKEDACSKDCTLEQNVPEADVGIATYPMEAVRRRLPGGGGARTLSSFGPVGCHVVPDEQDEFTTSRPHQKCQSCRQASPFIYAQGWICLQTECSRFWKLVDVKERIFVEPPLDLAYSTSFLAWIKTPPEKAMRLPFSVVPPSDLLQGEMISGSSWKGIVCRACGKASSRERWDHWQCTSCLAVETSGNANAPVVRAEELSRPLTGPSVLGDDFFDSSSGIVLTVGHQLGLAGLPVALVLRYALPSGAGSVWHVKPYDLEPFNKLFEDYQDEASSSLFTRNALQQHNSAGRLLAQHFTFNAGEDYKFVVDQNRSLSFDQAPKAVRDGLRLITETVFQVCGSSVNFNEVLSVAYKELQQMNWHDDGERGLGSIVSSLSLGSDAQMMFRPKPLRKEKNASFRAGTSKSAAAPSSSGVVSDRTTLTLRLMHGDFVIMGGENLQRMYDHCVVPSGFRIAATAREITELHRTW
ncbi:hypothetical protein BDY24DRAFT_168941 [Mrakia frigida]|uniref:uncharacterized protein n=1 Tax=Mrakia frigida TaxID=29902 RepID=UPI003FCBF4D7